MASNCKWTLTFIFSLIISFSTNSFLPNGMESETEDMTPMYLVCLSGMVEVVVAVDDGSIYMFLHKWFWKLSFDKESMEIKVVNQTASDISKEWANLPSDIEIGFTIQESDIPNYMAGHTLFVKGEQYFLFKNNNYIRNGSIRYWESHNWKNIRFVATLKNTSLVFVAKRRESIFSSSRSGLTYLFDDPSFPEKLSRFEIIDEYLELFDWTKLKYLIPLPHNEAFLAIFDSGTSGGEYCVVKDFKSQCNIRAIHQLFNCSIDLWFFKNNDFVYNLWKLTGLSVHEFLIALIGGSLAALLINILFITISTIRFVQLN